MSVILGLNGADGVGHDAAAAIIVENKLAVAVEEERLSRVKRAYGSPPLRSLTEVLDAAKVDPNEIDVVAYPWWPAAMGVRDSRVENQIRGWFSRVGLSLSPRAEIRFIEHHVAHAWAGIAFIPGGVQGRRVGVLVLDGSGESTSGAAYLYDESLERQWNLEQASSLGIYYEAVTQYLGFSWGDEGKTMGLASYGRPTGIAVPPLVDKRFDGPLRSWRSGGSTPRDLHADARQHLIDQFHRIHGVDLSFNARADIALAAQQVMASRILEYVKELAAVAEVLVLSGGVALNCAINAEVASLVRGLGLDLVIPPPASDTGVAIGAAIAASSDPGSTKGPVDAYLGRQFDADEVLGELAKRDVRTTPSDAASLATRLATDSLVCGWFEGRSEVGPRALGKRAILGRPDSAKVRDRMNYVKGREAWRPLAPSVTAGEFERSFGGSTPSEHMLISARSAPGALDRLAGVIHVDNSSRPQVVSSKGPYLDLLVEMSGVCGSEAVVCTSFNRAGEPIVYSPDDALRTAQEMGLDLLAGDGWCCDLRRS